MKNISFSHADAQDIDALFSLNREIIEKYEDPSQIDIEGILAWVRRKLEKLIGEYRRILVDGEIVGYLHFTPNGDMMELDDFYILPAHRKQGIGSAALEMILAETQRPVFLYVFTQNEGAIRLYRRFGFEIAETVSPTRLILQRNPQ